MQMKRFIVLFIPLFIILFAACNTASQKTPSCLATTYRVGIFDGHGGAQTCIWEAYEAMRLDRTAAVRYVTTSDIRNGVLDSLEVLVIPGGGGSRQYLNMGVENHQRIRAFAERGGGIVGICAGAYLLSNTPGYACLNMSGARAIDIEHDNRGHGLAKVTLTDAGKTLFPEIQDLDTCYIVYYEGPVYDTTDCTANYLAFATMESDVHTEGNAPANMTNGRPFFIGSEYGKGRIFSSIAHPEATPGMQWMVARMARWAANLPTQEFDSTIVEPNRFGHEILFTPELLAHESSCYNTFLYGTESEKLEALQWLESHVSWDAKRWVQGLVNDGSPAVRAQAAEYIARSGFTHYLPDIAAACRNETDPATKQRLIAAYNTLSTRIGGATWE